MLKRLDFLFWLLIAIVMSRLISMALIPMFDTTEPRYAEIARIMAESGDWITPWFDYGIPFWGKPPLSFWLEALSFKLFGITEFSARLPSWLAHVISLWLIYNLVRHISSHRQGLIAALIFSSMALSLMLSGAVLTDPFLSLGTTLSLVSIILALKFPHSMWGWWFFIGLAIGLLAKGPLAVVLILGPIFLWILWRRQWRDLLVLPWIRGIALTLLLVLPWYIAAELKTPGFINYFIIGEHFLRFIDPGWEGDLYGNAHKRAYGTIWIYWLEASFPWGLIAIFALLWRTFTNRAGKIFRFRPLSDELRLLLLSAIFPSLFFTFSGNILATYQLTSLAPFAILLAILMFTAEPVRESRQIGTITAMLIMPLALIVLSFYAHYYPNQLKTEKTLVAYYEAHSDTDAYPLIYINRLPFSARYYSKGRSEKMDISEFKLLMEQKKSSTFLISIRNTRLSAILPSIPGGIKHVFKNSRFTLLQISPAKNRINVL